MHLADFLADSSISQASFCPLSVTHVLWLSANSE